MTMETVVLFSRNAGSTNMSVFSLLAGTITSISVLTGSVYVVPDIIFGKFFLIFVKNMFKKFVQQKSTLRLAAGTFDVWRLVQVILSQTDLMKPF